MASLLSRSLLPCVFILCSFSLPSSASRGFQAFDSQKVSLGVYYESLCPFSANFIVNYLANVFDNGLISIIDLNLVPYGNAKIGPNNTINCQHGPSECLLNTVEACAINVWPDLNKHFPFIDCIESSVYERKYPEWVKCFEKLGLDSKPVADCYSSGYGKKLDLQYAAETNSLQPPHKYVPWIVVDGQPLYEDYENYVSYVCNAYKGISVPQACGGLYLNTNPKAKSNAIGPVSYAETKTMSTLSMRIRSAVTSLMHQINKASM